LNAAGKGTAEGAIIFRQEAAELSRQEADGLAGILRCVIKVLAHAADKVSSAGGKDSEILDGFKREGSQAV